MSKDQIPKPNLYSLFLILILFIAAFLRFYCLTCSSLWHDEGNTWALMSRSFGGIAAAAAADIHPPGYYWLLKVWTHLFGADVLGLRSLSAMLGVALVVVVHAMGRQIGSSGDLSVGARRSAFFFPLLAAFLTAINPFLVYYSQEARMYALLALLSAILFWAVTKQLAVSRLPLAQKAEDAPHTTHPAVRSTHYAVYSLAAAAGLWTHYSFPVVIAAAVVVYVWHWARPSRSPIPNPRSPIPFLIANALALLAFLPWLPTAVDRVLSWPAGGEDVTLVEGARLTVQTLLIGPIRAAPDLAWPWLLLAGIAPLLGIWALRRTPAGITLGIWLLAPILLMLGLGLFSDAFLKFLIIAAPAWCLLTATIPLSPYRCLSAALLILTLSALLSAATLPGYYADPLARDNYAGMARTVAALADPERDLVLLAAPGQREVWRYYDPGVPVLALPQQRPLDRGMTEASLAENTADRHQIFAIFWALDEADPQGIVERWLDARAFKGLESWQGNVRFVRYSLPNGMICDPLDPPSQFGDLAQLTELCFAQGMEIIPAGESLLIGLRWQALTSTERRFKVTLQLLDHRNQVIAQRDGEPAGGSLATVDWQPGDRIVDNHALFIPPGTPPGEYQLILALYDAETGARLPVDGQDALTIGAVQIRPGSPLPLDIVPIHHRVDAQFGAVTLIGYDAYRRGYAHAPETPLSPGDLLHVTLYWQAPDPLPVDWSADLQVTLALGDQMITAPLAGGLYPTAEWPDGAFVRGEFNIPYTGGDSGLWVQIGEARRRLQRVPIRQ